MLALFLLQATSATEQSAQLSGEDVAKQHLEWGNARYLKGDFDGAIREYTNAIKIDPENVLAHISRAISRYKVNDPEGAILDYTMAIRLDPKSQVAYNNRGLIKLSRGDNDGAIEDFTKSLSINLISFSSYFSRGKARFNKGDYEGAIADFTMAIKINHRPIEPYYLRANAKLRIGDKEGAIQDYTGAIAGNAEYAPLYNERGLVKFDIGDYNGAIGDYSRAIRVDPNFVDAYNNRGIAKHKAARYDEAIEDFTEAIGIDRRYAPAYANRANVREDKGDYAGALRDFTLAIGHNPKDALSYRRRAHIHYNAERWPDALRDFSKALQLESGARDQDYAILRIWLALARMGEDRDKANTILEGHLKGQPSKNTGSWYRNLCSFLLGKLSEDALIAAAEDADLQKAQEKKCEACFYAGSMHIIQGDTEGALRLMRLCLATGIEAFSEYQSARAEIESILFGAHFEAANEQARNSAVLDRNVGFTVSSVAASGSEHTSALKQKDLLAKINDRPATEERLKQLCEIGLPGQTVELTVYRQSRKITVPFKLAGRQYTAER